jgi:maltose alpha-D-glucosyltransferase/alpha-amylase
LVLLENDPLWYKDAIIYELHVRAFADSRDDGIGDFRGLMGKLDYLQDLGVTALWLLPFYPSPLRDDGYDIADYTDVNPIYGSLAEFKAFLRTAHRRGLRVITELVLNHTSDQHPWFQRARRAPPGSRWRNFYVWSQTCDRYKEARIIFKDFESSNWTWDEVAQAYYWHRFYAHQPDLNYDSPDVQRAVLRIVDFWLNMGIDGLRLDAVPYLYEREGTNCENLPESHAFLRQLRRHIDAHFPNRMLLAEANQWPEDAVAYFGHGDECHMAFHFPLMPRLFMAIRMEDRFPIIDILQQTPAIPPTCQWALFLRNHDELTLEMVTDEDRDYMYRVYAQDSRARINLGIRRRLAPLLENHRGKIELMNGLLLSLPGTPVLYYGDEIGMGDNIFLGDRNGVRTPMQWSPERNAGFSAANPQRLYLPVITDPEYHYQAVNVEMQQNNPHSLLWWMKHLLALRKRFQAFGRGSLEFLYPDNPKVLAYVRRYHDERVLVVANLSRLVQYVELDLSAFKGSVPVEMRGRMPFPPIGDRPYLLTLSPYGFYWFALDWFPAEARPGPELTPRAGEVAAAAVPGEAPALPSLTARGRWEDVLEGKARPHLEEILVGYLKCRPWFAGKVRPVSGIKFCDRVAFGPESMLTRVVLVQVEYREGDPETYLLPLAFAQGEPAELIRRECPWAVVARLQVHGAGNGECLAGVLYDPVERPAFAAALLDAVLLRRRFKGMAGEIVGSSTAAARRAGQSPEPPPRPSIRHVDPSDTLIGFGDRWQLKLFRRLEEGVNPELEMGRFLTYRVGFAHVPPVAGALEYRREQREPITLAVLQQWVPHQGDAWQFTLDALGRYFDKALTLLHRAPDLPLPARPLLDLVGEEIPPLISEALESYAPLAQLLGQRTGELHAALASVRDDPHFAPEPFTMLYQRSLYQSVRTQVRQTLELLRKRWPDLAGEARDMAGQVLKRENELLGRLRAILDRKIEAVRIHCHGDYHLARVLYTGKDFVIDGLEGDPGRPFSERRRKRSPLRDVTSMLRSFHYASQVALGRGNVRREDMPVLAPWANLWQLWVSVLFLKGYLPVARQASVLPATQEDLRLLLHFYLLKRAANELRYDLLHYPDRVHVPLQGLLQTLEAKA